MTRNILILVALLLILASCPGNRPVGADGKNDELADCPDRPNCVSSLSDDPKQYIAPLTYEGSPSEAAARLLSVLEQMEGAEIVSRTDTMIHAEFASTVFGFVDDVTFRFDAADRRIDLRSASRVGYTDFGVNRRRIAEIRNRFQTAATSEPSPPHPIGQPAMTSPKTIDYSSLDRPEILSVLFHPRPSYGDGKVSPPARELMIPVDEKIAVGACFHAGNPAGPNILFFHGNGEIVDDYNDLGPLYTRMGINFLAVDYRGYGRSGGRPSVSTMMSDCHKIFDWTVEWLQKNGHSGPLVVMGRSLGSAPALELASRRLAHVDGLIIESGFAYAAPLLKLLGVSPAAIGFREAEGFANIDKIRQFDKPTLIIHGEFDHIIAYSEGKALYDACPAAEKVLLKIAGANHNDLFARGLTEYLNAVKTLTTKLSG